MPGILDPRIIGDKPKWYSHYVQPLFFQVHNPHSRLGCDLYEDSDDSDSEKELPSTIEEEGSNLEEDGKQTKEGANDCCDNCSCCSTSETDSSGDDDNDDLFNNANDSETMFDGSCYDVPPTEIELRANSVTTMPAYRFVVILNLSSIE